MIFRLRKTANGEICDVRLMDNDNKQLGRNEKTVVKNWHSMTTTKK